MMKIDLATDLRIYRLPWVLSESGQGYLPGTDLLAHIDSDGLCLYYFCHYGMYMTERTIEPVTREEAGLFLKNVILQGSHRNMRYDEFATAKNHFPELFDE
jgi:hypothetical protein